MKTSESGHEELTNMERNRAYGIDLLRVDPHEVRFTVKALAGVKFRATESSDESGSRVTTTAEVDGKEISLREVFISTKGRGLFLRVLSIDFSGIEPETGAAVTRRITLRR